MGDFNFPSVVWSDGYGLLNPNPTYGSELNNVFLETMNDASLEQYVTEPTRQNNILDLVLSNNNNIHNLNVVPGISDHDAIQFQLSVTHKSAIHKPPHKNYNGGSISLYLTNTGSLELSYTIEAPGVGYYTSGAISGTSSKVVKLSSSLITNSYNDQNKGIHLETNSTNVTVIGQNDVSQSSDTFLALPTVKVCCTHCIYYGISVSSGVSQYDNVILIVGTEDNTMMNLTVTQSVNVSINDTISSLTHGSQYSFIVSRLQTVYIGSSSDLTGTRIITDKPVSVFSGHECGNVPSLSYRYCDHLVEQIPPTTYWGKTYYIAPLQGRSAYTIRVLAAYNSTEVFMDCNNVKNSYTINAGNCFTVTHQYYCAIHSNKEILVAQYSIGNPMMMLVPATMHYDNEINLSTISSGYNDYINIIVLKEYYQPSMMYWITGGVKRSLQSQSWNTITFNQVTEAYYTQLSVSNGPVTIIHTTANALMSAVVYGFDYSDAYGHPGGFSVQKKIQG
ncbi:uncharacterized protein [Dysidea avara]|uniref:uncharacterized protein n=1 Tax=Dysidea avara TaxID=196820 RepID=UPI003333E4B1